MPGEPLTPEEEREGIIRVLKLGVASGLGAGLGAEVCRRVVQLLEAPCADEVAAAKLAQYETFMTELAEEIELMSDHGARGAVTVWIEQATYDSLQRYRK